MGRAMAALPISPRHGRMLFEVLQQQPPPADEAGGRKGGEQAERALPYAIALAAALSLESPFIHARDGDGGEQQEEEEEDGEGGGGEQAAVGDGEAAAAARRRRKAVGAAQAALRCGDSDALSALKALCAYEAAGRSDAFCASARLQARGLREMSQLRRQLARTLQMQVAPSAGSALAARLQAEAAAAAGESGALRPPSSAVQALLRRAMAAGWADQVARRVRTAEHVRKALAEPGGRRHAVRYAAAGLAGEDAFLHPASSLHATAPEYVLYASLVRGAKRPYMACVTAVEAAWLAASASPLCALSAPLDEPPPFYRAATDAVMAWHSASYGPQGWPLPLSARPHSDARARAATFAAALLDGRVLAGLAPLAPLLAAQPALAARPEMRGVPRVGELVGALVAARVDSRASLAAAWRARPGLLQAELAAWLPRAKQPLLLERWPALLEECLRGGGDGGGVSGGGDAGGKRPKKAGRHR
jgi:ATP-dependent RNA helicase DHX37/DHR1